MDLMFRMSALFKAVVVALFGIAIILFMVRFIKDMKSGASSDLELFSEPVVVTYFYMESCPYCKQMREEWNKFKGLAKTNNISTKEASPDTDGKLVKEKNVTGFPTVLVSVGSKDTVYPSDADHPRTAEALLAFVKKQAAGPRDAFKGNRK